MFNRLKLFWQLLTHQNPPNYLQNACYRKPSKAWQYSKLVDGVQILSLVKCSLCDGNKKIYGSKCPRCENGEVAMLNPMFFVDRSDRP